jgi:colanic acid biosynthesis glycosyl transferase WcaI
LQPQKRLSARLASAACHLVVQLRGVADAVLPSKLTNILAVGGNTVITADPETTLGKLCGIRRMTALAGLFRPTLLPT